MELVRVNNKQQLILKPAFIETVESENVRTSSDVHFIAANTEVITIEDLKKKHTIPVFAKDNETTLAHQDFIETVQYVAGQIFSGEEILQPAIRASHVIKGRHPSAIHKKVNELQETDKLTYYERLAFAIEIPTIYGDISGNALNLTVGGVRAYNLENLYTRKTEEHFKLFIGFKNKVCCNLCVSTDGFKAEVKVRTIAELAKAAYNLFGEFNVYRELDKFNNLPGTIITESQFAQIVGRARLYQNMPFKQRKDIPTFPLSDGQVNLVVKDYYSDKSFAKEETGNINLWKLYNLFTGANKMSYIDTFLDRGVGCQQFVNGLYEAIGVNRYHWFIN
ncbi:MAG TPA: hypothetical protein DER09_02215 [Prolixibacteraceae bacterium]|nr:hypothetical protein [Prolixibacteraceae bacterium]